MAAKPFSVPKGYKLEMIKGEGIRANRQPRLCNSFGIPLSLFGQRIDNGCGSVSSTPPSLAIVDITRQRGLLISIVIFALRMTFLIEDQTDFLDYVETNTRRLTHFLKAFTKYDPDFVAACTLY